MKLLNPKYAIYIVLITALIIDISLKNWEKPNRVIEHDVHSYYSYLPALFIYDDIKLEKDDYRFGDNYYFFWGQPDKNGNKVAKMTCGLSILYAPFFFIAHFITLHTDYPPDGFSEPYKLFLLISALFYLFIGLDFTSKILKLLEFNNKTSFLTILLLGIGTNLLAYSSQSATMSHCYSFCLFSGFIYNTIKWHESRSIKRIIFIGLLFGLISLVRPSNSLIILFFIFYGISSINDFKNKLVVYKENFYKLLLLMPLTLFVWIPQFLYWKKVSGEWIYYSYREEGFYFLDPKILEGLFSFRKGWLVYTPIMVFALVGIFLLKGKPKLVKSATIIFIIINVYVVFSWWCWWYGGTFGQRVLVESYALLVIPLASFINWINTKRILYKAFFYIISLFFIWLNIFQTYQFEKGSLHWDGMTKELYFKQFWKFEKIEKFDSMVDKTDYDAAKYRGKMKNELKEKSKQKNYTVKKVNIIAFNDKYLCLEKNRTIVADRDIAQEWETFEFNLYKNNELSIIGYDADYLSADFGKNGELTAVRKDKYDWETFIIEYLTNDTIAIKTSNGKYLTVDSNTLKINAIAEKIGKYEKFKLIKLSND